MIHSIINHPFVYEAENVIRIFYPNRKLTTVYTEILLTDNSSDYIITERQINESSVLLSCSVNTDGKSITYKKSTNADEQQQEILLAQLIYAALSEICDYKAPWGIVTGVRPSKLLRNLMQEMGRDTALNYFKSSLLVSDKKASLALAVADAQEPSIRLSRNNSYSLYISIPFCPSRCSYCSFVSHSVAQAKKLIPDYIDFLCRELKETAEIADSLGLRLETVYFGGGTPTSLSHSELSRITDAVGNYFDLSNIREYTIEAGRPDTLTDEKLAVMKNAGVTRISINPQTFNPDVLKAIGRNHSPNAVLEAFSSARSMGFDNINMDFIAGLPEDSAESFAASIDKAVSLNPENITVHTLAMKRASNIVARGEQNTAASETGKMLDYASETLYKNGYHPYYMYRQSKSVGNNENVGWSKNGYDCLYNIYMMEEIHTVLAVGSGAVSRLKSYKDGYIERIFNFKYPYEYINRFDIMSERKKKINEFYSNLKG